MAPDAFLTTVTDFESLPVAGSVLDLDGTIIAVNNAATRLIARPAAEIIGRKTWEFAPGIDHIWDDLVANARKQDSHGEVTIATPLGSRAIHYITGLREYDGRTVAVVFAVETAPSEASPDVGTVDPTLRIEALGLFAGGIAHDFNNQLVSVLAEASAAREDKNVPLSVAESLRRIESAAQRMALMTRQLLAYAGRGRVVLEVIDPDELITETSGDLQRLAEPNGTLAIKLGAASTAVKVDRSQLREVICNLVGNAFDALHGVSGTVRVTTGQFAGHGTMWWRVEVSDSGAGIEPSIVERIFDPFFTTKPERHGLGLAVAQGIVRRFGGQIRATSEPGRGATFSVLLPIVATNVTPAKRSRTASESAVSLRAVSVLVADDEPSVRATLRRLLERRGAFVILASDGDEAAAALVHEPYDLVLLDVMMPKQTGYQLMPQVRRLQPTAKVILMSGYTDGAAGTGSNDEPDAFLEKPFTTKQLDEMVDGVLGT